MNNEYPIFKNLNPEKQIFRARSLHVKTLNELSINSTPSFASCNPLGPVET